MTSEVGKTTPGPWRWTTVDYGKNLSTYVDCGNNGDFDALWSDAENKPVFVAQDASSYTATCDFPVQEDAVLIAAAPALLEALEDIEHQLLNWPGMDPVVVDYIMRVTGPVLALARGGGE